MLKRLAIPAAIAFVLATAAWLFFGSTIRSRTYSTTRNLDSRIRSHWGAEQTQLPPEVICAGESAQPESSKISAALGMDYRRKGFIWYSTYNVAFKGAYRFAAPVPATGSATATAENTACKINFYSPSSRADLQDILITINGLKFEPELIGKYMISGEFTPSKSGMNDINISYKTRGLKEWKYSFAKYGGSEGDPTQIKNFELVVNTDFESIDFPFGTMSPNMKTRSGSGWKLVWKWNSLIAAQGIGIITPERQNAGPIAARLSTFAPISLLFFFIIILLIVAARGMRFHPVHFFFIAAAFISFNALFAFVSDHLTIFPAFGVSAAVSVVLLVSYLGAAVGWRFAVFEAGIAQLIYLVGFSFVHLYKGYTGLSIVIMSVFTLFIIMQASARMDWDKLFDEARGGEKMQEPSPAPLPTGGAG